MKPMVFSLDIQHPARITWPLVVLLGLLVSRTPLAAESLTNSLGMSFTRIPAGEFTMGLEDVDEAAFELPDGDVGNIQDERPPHPVRITRDFYLGTTEVTQADWFALMDSRPGPESHWKRPDWVKLPVVSVSWQDTQDFIARLNAKEPGTRYRLPTEAEWEYAARASSQGLRPFPLTELDNQAWYLKNSGDEPQPVASRQANAWGLYDMLGNAWEWVADRYGADYYRRSATADPMGPETGGKRVRRGGSYHCQPHLVRPGYRAADLPETRYSVLGFRIVRDSLP